MQYEKGSQLEKIIQVLKVRELSDSVGIWFAGEAGRGKTHLLLSLFNKISFDYFYKFQSLKNQVKFYNYSDLCGILRQDPNNYDLLCSIRSVDFLFIDDIGTTKVSDFIQEKVYSIFNYRCENELPTFATTNLKPAQITAEFTERMGSRIKESSVWIELKTSKDFRTNNFLKNMEKYKGLT